MEDSPVLPGGVPAFLSDTGLFEGETDTIVAEAIEYQPGTELWADSALKQRWVLIPDDEMVDTSDMDAWVFPEGTKAWKQFSLEGNKVETRMLWKRENGWLSVSYLWDDDGSVARAVPDGANNVNGTSHDVPSQAECAECHNRLAEPVLGFGAIQLSSASLPVSVTSLSEDGLLSDVPAAPIEIPGNEVEVAALSYLHGNCGGCHNPNSDVAEKVDVMLRLRTDALENVEDTSIYQTSVNVPLKKGLGSPEINRIIKGGVPEESAIFVRMNSRADDVAMPPVATEQIDQNGVAAVQAWIQVLPVE